MAVEGLLLHRSRCSSSRSHCRLRDTSPSQDFRRLGRFRKIERWRPSRSSSSSCPCSRDRPRSSKSAGSWPDLPLGFRRPSSRGKGGYLHKSNGRHSRTRSSSPTFARSRSRGQRPHRRSRSGSYSPSPHSFRSSRPRSRSRCRSPIFLKSSRDGDKDLDSYRSIRDREFCGSHRHQDRCRARSLYNSHHFYSRSRSYDWENKKKMQLQITPPLLQDCGLCSSVRPGSRLGVKRGLMLRNPRRGVRLDGKKDLSALLSDGIAREQKLQKIGNINADAVQWAQVHLQ